MHDSVGLDDLSPVFFFIASRPVAPTSSDRVRVPVEPHVLIYHTATRLLPPILFARIPSVPPWRTGAGEVRDVVFRRVDNPILLVQINHRRLNIRMAQHGLDLSNGRSVVQGQRRGRMTQRMGRDWAEVLRLGIEEPSEAGLLQMVPHHGLDGPDA